MSDLTQTGQNDPQERAADADNPRTIAFGYHVVALVDLLGQAEALARWDAPPDTPSQLAEFEKAFRDSFGLVSATRREFEEYFNIWLASSPLPDSIVRTAPDGGEALRKFKETSLSFSHFSDTLIVYSPIQNQHGHPYIGNAVGFVVACGSLLLCGLCGGLCERVALRGAIEVGMAARFPDADLYGPALAKAHHLESKCAQYPRIVVGPTLMDALDAYAHNQEDSAPARANRFAASMCLKLLVKDEDDCWIVDYLSDQFAELNPNPDGWRGLYRLAFQFVQAERSRFERQGDSKLTERYDRLVAYFHSHGVKD